MARYGIVEESGIALNKRWARTGSVELPAQTPDIEPAHSEMAPPSDEVMDESPALNGAKILPPGTKAAGTIAVRNIL
jgi:hypothetical protein